MLPTLLAVLAAAPGPVLPASPRLAELDKKLAAGDKSVLASFWQDVEKAGTPLVEPADDPDFRLVTFLWRAGPKDNLTNVILLPGPNGVEPARNRLERLRDTDLWFRTFRLKADARLGYSFSTNDPLTPVDEGDPKARAERFANVRLDPFNPNRWTVLLRTVSVLELPSAPPATLTKARTGLKGGTVVETKLTSESLKQDRPFQVYLPPGYDSKAGNYPLLVVFDGLLYTSSVPGPTILDNLITDHKIPPTVAVFIPSTDRTKDLSCNDFFADFLAKELVPHVREKYGAGTDPARTVTLGSSLGGLTAAFAALRYPAVFGGVFSQSGSFWWKPDADPEPEWLARQMADAPKRPVRYYLEVGLMEQGPTPDGGPSMVTVNRHLRDVLKARGFEAEYREFNGGHDYLNWRVSFADGVTALLAERREQ